MPSPKDDAYLLNIWQDLEKKYISSGLSRWSSIKKIADVYSVSPRTVYYWLTPSYREQELKLSRSEKYKKKKRDWARKPENRTLLSEYSKKYRKRRRNLPYIIEELFLEGNTMTFLSISEKLKEETNIRFDRKIILSAIAKYNYENEGSPIIEIEPERYKLKDTIF